MVLREETELPGADSVIFRLFNSEIMSRVPRIDHREGGPTIVNETPLLDMTNDLVECARAEYGLDLSGKDLRVFGKLESKIFGGSIKVRPAVQIIREAIISGKLRQHTTVFEATSGNFGIALGLMGSLGLDVVALVSRKLQTGVVQELKNVGVKTINLDIDICPVPGVSSGSGGLAAKVVASSVRSQLSEYGFDLSALDDSREQVEDLLAREDAIGLAKLLSKTYGGFCPEQYENDMNARAHETLTGPEIEQQLRALGQTLGEFDLVCTFGTGGTSAGLSRYAQSRFGRKSVQVVFPLANQDVAGIRSKQKALGLRFYEPERYAGQYEVNYEEAGRTLAFFLKKGYDIGESSALAICATIQMVNGGVGSKFVVILADGIRKYRMNTVATAPAASLEVTAEEAISNAGEFGGVIWTHPVFVPSETGMELLASSLGLDTNEIDLAGSGDVERLYSNRELPEGLRSMLPSDGKKLLLVCVNGGTSLRLARLLSERGIAAVSLTGGIAALSSARGRATSDLIELAS